MTGGSRRSPRSLGARLVLVIVVVSGSAACGSEDADPVGDAVATGGASPSRDSTESPASAHEPADLPDAPPSVRVSSGDREVELEPWTYCYGNGCVDGIPPDEPDDLGAGDELVVEFPLEGRSFTAGFAPAGEKCGHVQDVPLTRQDEGRFVLGPAGHPGTYDVTLFGQGDGDLVVSFVWTTTSEGPLARPEARAAVLADNDGELDSYGVELVLDHVAATPADATARITVRDAAGQTVAFGATSAPLLDADCFPEGWLYWDGPDDQGVRAATTLGAGPYTYEVVVTIDGTRHTATATWPDDVISGNEPSVALHFTPELPARP